jgi:hypothetical protein
MILFNLDNVPFGGIHPFLYILPFGGIYNLTAAVSWLHPAGTGLVMTSNEVYFSGLAAYHAKLMVNNEKGLPL